MCIYIYIYIIYICTHIYIYIYIYIYTLHWQYCSHLGSRWGLHGGSLRAGAISEPSWGLLGPCSGHIGSLGAYFGSSWAILDSGSSWGHIGLPVEFSWAIMRLKTQYGAVCCTGVVILGPPGPHGSRPHKCVHTNEFVWSVLLFWCLGRLWWLAALKSHVGQL